VTPYADEKALEATVKLGIEIYTKTGIGSYLSLDPLVLLLGYSVPSHNV